MASLLFIPSYQTMRNVMTIENNNNTKNSAAFALPPGAHQTMAYSRRSELGVGGSAKTGRKLSLFFRRQLLALRPN